MPRSVSGTALGKGRLAGVASGWATRWAGRLAQGGLLAWEEGVALGAWRTRMDPLRKQGSFFLKPDVCTGSTGHPLRSPGGSFPEIFLNSIIHNSHRNHYLK